MTASRPHAFRKEDAPMYCGKCGTKMPDEEIICPNCGADMSPPPKEPEDEKRSFFRRLMDKIKGR